MPNKLRKVMNEDVAYEVPEKDAIRQAIMDEMEAIVKYNTYMDQAVSEEAAQVLGSIRDEEKVHVGELLALLMKIDPEEAARLKEGNAEVRELLEGGAE